MKFINKSILLAFISFIIGCVASDISIGMKLLVISTSKPDSVIKTLQAYSIEYDYLEYNYKNPLTGDLPLYTKDNQPKYYGIVFGNGALSVLHEDTGLWGSIFSPNQWAYLDEYQKKYGVRVVALDDSPNAAYGTGMYNPNIWGVSSTQDMTMANNDIAKSLYTEAGIKTTVTLNTQGLYHIPVKVVDNKLATPIVVLQPNEEITGESVVATYFKNEEGLERLSFYISFGDWSLNSVMLNHLWVTWVTRSLYAGERRVTFTPHIDDVFISTGLLNFETNELESSTNAYRSTVEDFEILKKWQENIVGILPPGSFIRSELAFNGNGILAVIDPSIALEVDGERYCEIEHIKKPGTGTNRWPVNNYSLTYTKEFLEYDSLFAYFEKEENSRNFFWSSHTFTHENLDEATISDADNEIRVNIEMAKLLGVYDKPYYSSHSIITPQISGLRNVDAINVFKKYGIDSGTGDLSRPTLVNQENPYLPFFTTKESSNYDGFPVIPRSPTEIYYSSSNIEENTHIYNLMYEKELGKSTWDDIVEREVNRAITLMMNLRNEAHQFHQINIRSHDIKDKEGLVEKWCGAVLKKYASLVEWPVTSLKLDDQAKLYLDRYDRITYCDVSKSAVIEGDYVTAVKITPNSIKKDCKIPITLPQDVSKDNDKKITFEKRGLDRLVAWVSFEKGDDQAKTIKLNPPLAWSTNATPLEENKPIEDKPIEDKPIEDNPIEDDDTDCWSKELGYRCCKKGESFVEFIDDDGWWGITKDETAEWCGIIRNEDCWAEDFGIPCCENEMTLTKKYFNNVIGYEEQYENDESRPAGGWCGLKSAKRRINSSAATIFKEQLGL